MCIWVSMQFRLKPLHSRILEYNMLKQEVLFYQLRQRTTNMRMLRLIYAFVVRIGIKINDLFLMMRLKYCLDDIMFLWTKNILFN